MITRPIVRAACPRSLLAALAALAVASAAAAQAPGPVQAPPSAMPGPVTVLAFPSTFGVPTAVAPRPRTAFVGATYASPRGGISGAGGDGDIVAGYSIGNPLDGVSLTFGLAITGIDPLGDAGAFSLSASRLLHAGGNSAAYIGASVTNIAAWGPNAARSEGLSAYFSHLLGVRVGNAEVPVQMTVGYGTDVTREKGGGGRLSDGLFAGIGVGITEQISASLSSTRTQINLGTTISLPGTGVSATLGVLDVTDNTNRRQFSLSVSYGF